MQSLFLTIKTESSSNLPTNSELANVSWSNHSIQILNAGLSIRPFAKTSKFNGREFISNYRNPNFRIRSKWGFSKAGDFNNTEIEYEQVFDLKRLGDLRLMVTAGDFLKNQAISSTTSTSMAIKYCLEEKGYLIHSEILITTITAPMARM
jgi:hypothetical protein